MGAKKNFDFRLVGVRLIFYRYFFHFSIDGAVRRGSTRRQSLRNMKVSLTTLKKMSMPALFRRDRKIDLS